MPDVEWDTDAELDEDIKPILEDSESDIDLHSDDENDKIRCEFFYDFLQFVIQHQQRLDKLTQHTIFKTIEQQQEELKERNLHTYKTLNKGAQIIQKELLRHKLDKWSNLATKERSKHSYQVEINDNPFAPDEEILEHREAMAQSNVRYIGEEDEDAEW